MTRNALGGVVVAVWGYALGPRRGLRCDAATWNNPPER